MFGVIFLIILIFLLVVFLLLYIKHKLFVRYLVENFKSCSCCVYGKKKTGKDLVFQFIINIRKTLYYANIGYGGNYKHTSLKDCLLGDNTYEDLINETIRPVKRVFVENKDIYISDIGNHAPAYMHNKLWNKYPSLPIFQSLSKHLYDNNFHCNAQRLNDIWLPIREQADFFVWTRRTTKIFGLLFIVTVFTYEKLTSANQCLYPLRKVHFNKQNKADLAKYYAVNGDIRSGHVFLWRWQLKYNPRAYEKIFLRGRRKVLKR